MTPKEQLKNNLLSKIVGVSLVIGTLALGLSIYNWKTVKTVKTETVVKTMEVTTNDNLDKIQNEVTMLKVDVDKLGEKVDNIKIPDSVLKDGWMEWLSRQPVIQPIPLPKPKVFKKKKSKTTKKLILKAPTNVLPPAPCGTCK